MTFVANIIVEKAEKRFCFQFEQPLIGVTAIFGMSGSGKTSLLRALAGLDNSHGDIMFAEQVWQCATHNMPTYKRSIGFVFQQPSLFPHLSVQQNIDYGRKRSTQGMSTDDLDKLLVLLDIKDLLQRDINDLSGGEQQRVAIARALAIKPQLLMMDEPLASLDEAKKHDIMRYLIKLKQSLAIPIFYVTHSSHEVACLADRVMIIADNKIAEFGKTSAMLNSAALSSTHGDTAFVTIEAAVKSHDETYGLTELQGAGIALTVAKQAVSLNTIVRVTIMAKDVSLTLGKAQDSSILNLLAGQITAIDNDGAAQVIVSVLVGESTIYARITKKSVHLLALTIGKPVFAQIKSVAIVS